MEEAKEIEGKPTADGISNPVQCTFCKLWFSRTAYPLHYLTHPTEIIPGLVFLGNEENAKDIETLRKLQISHILNTASDCANFYPESFVYHNLNLVDENTTPLLDALDKGVAILRENERSHVRTLVHCVVGASRSASVVIAWLMVRNAWPLHEALDHVKRKRGLVRPNDGFVHQLGVYEVRLRGGQPSYPRRLANTLSRQSSLPAHLASTPGRARTPPPPLSLRRTPLGPALEVIPASQDNTPQPAGHPAAENDPLAMARAHTDPRPSKGMGMGMGREGLASGITADDATAAVHCWWGDQGLDNEAATGAAPLDKASRQRRASVAQRKGSLDSAVDPSAAGQDLDGLEDVIKTLGVNDNDNAPAGPGS